MAEQQGFKFPLGLLVFDGIGTMLVGLGLAKMFADVDIIPANLLFDEKGWTLIIVGGLLMLPFMFSFFSQFRSKAEQNIVK